MPNQWKPTPPLDIIQLHILRLWKARQTDKQIVVELQKHFDLSHYDMPMVTQSDPGSENFGIANTHTMLCQWHDPALQGFESLLDHGVMSGWYDSNNTLQMMVFQWVFIPWLQQELDGYQDRVNNTRKRRDQNKILPHGVPNIVYQSPEDFSALDFKITVEHEALDHVRNLYIDPSHIVFNLVPQSLGKLIQCYYEELGHPSVTRQSAWDVYLLLLDMLQCNEEIPSAIEDVEEDLPLLENYQDLPYHEDNNGAYYMGGVGGGLGLDNLICDDEPKTTGSIDEDIGLDHDGLVVWEFSDFSDVSDGDADVDEW
ncbi:uncharacterized protein EDB93DRAFT_1239551 [Suillus bovinus]|uniref:uncharacterized protein n=1 Tax=Suillus bovinus TaxID=48563 RepID=UPI001B8717E8|nr:uncharacterized protein EDB93DRAFT_1239551 [Suillus bovinus]KAG2154171.1 hypothetical protein EDB93DRAFT_1239551 [Suillus bovinus]